MAGRRQLRRADGAADRVPAGCAGGSDRVLRAQLHAGLHLPDMRMVRADAAIDVYVHAFVLRDRISYLFTQHYRTGLGDEKEIPTAHQFALNAICSHYVIRGLEALLLRRYSSPFFPPTLNTLGQLLTSLSSYLFHYFVVMAHFFFAARADYSTGNTLVMYVGYAVAIVGQIRMLKNADLIPGASGVSSHQGDLMSWVGIALITQHAGIWALVLCLWPFAQCEYMIEVWTGQRYGMVMSPLRTKQAVYIKDVPGLAEELLPLIAEKALQWGEIQSVAVRPRATADCSDVYLVFKNSLAAGMAASNLDGSTVGGFRVNATQRTFS